MHELADSGFHHVRLDSADMPDMRAQRARHYCVRAPAAVMKAAHAFGSRRLASTPRLFASIGIASHALMRPCAADAGFARFSASTRNRRQPQRQRQSYFGSVESIDITRDAKPMTSRRSISGDSTATMTQMPPIPGH